MIGLVTTSFDEGADGFEGDHGLAWAIPAPDGSGPCIQRERSHSLDGAISILCGILSAGLAGADPLPRKRKSVRAANVVEYSLMAISPEKFGTRDAFYSKWKSLWSSSAPVTATNSSDKVSLQASDAQRLAELAAKIKFVVSWSLT